MIYRALADATAIFHFTFVLFVAFGALFVLRWPRLAWVHLPCAIWGLLIEIMDWTCPLTKYENIFRIRGGMAGYGDDFIAHYLFGIIYPTGLTRTMQFIFAACVFTINTAVYARLTFRRRS